MGHCRECVRKQQRINELEEDVKSLKAKLRHQERSIREGVFGSSTPSSKLPVKPEAVEERQARKGGGKPGHAGHGRARLEAQEADEVISVPLVCDTCPDCGGPLERSGRRQRAVIECWPVRMRRIIYSLERALCPKCRRRLQAQAPGVLPRSLYGNQLLAHAAVEHYVNGRTLGQIERETGVGYSGILEALKTLAGKLQKVPDRLIADWRASPVKHADETGWRTDGRNGYAWLFAAPNLRVFRFRSTRSGAVAREVFGPDPLPGVLVVDRYGAYNKAPVALQYCWAHLLRDLEDVGKDFPDDSEVAAFVQRLAPLLSSAMGLRAMPIKDRRFKSEAEWLKKEIQSVIAHSASHPAIQSYQDIFRSHPDRLYHWAEDRAIPADNNLAERELRSLVIARKLSFGSQSQAGAATREILMTVLLTLKTRVPDLKASFKNFLDQLALNPNLDPYHALFNNNSS